jgi:hypothetical protein
MTDAEAAAYREQYRKATAKATGRFEHWPSEEAKQQHLQQVKEAQEAGAPF